MTVADPSVKEVLTAMAESSSIHGVSRWVTSTHWYQRALWLLVFLGATGGAFYQLSRLYISYTSYPVKTSMELEFSSLTFPAVSFCNMNPIKTTKLSLTTNETQKALQTRSKRSLDPQNINAPSDSKPFQLKIDRKGRKNGRCKNPVLDLRDVIRRIRKRRNAMASTTPSFVPQTSSLSSGTTAPNYQWVTDANGNWYHFEFLSDMTGVQDEWNSRVEKFKTEFQDNDLYTREEVGHSISDMLVSCAFNGNLCYKENFTLFQSLEYGNCYTFEGESYVSRRSGPNMGLRLVLNIETKEYIENYMDAPGIRLVIHQRGTLPFPEEEGITLNPNYETSIGMRMQSIHRASEPYGSCDTGEEFFNLFGIGYTVPACLKLCRQTEILKRCNCRPSTTSLDLGIADMKKYKSCLDKDYTITCEDFVINSIEKNRISCNCRSPCNQNVYKTSLSGRRWPNKIYLEGNLLPAVCGTSNNKTYFKTVCSGASITPTDLAWLEENFLKAVIYYEDLNFEKISEEPLYDGYQLISDVGGALGLFMGASILSFVEVLQFIIELINFLRHKIAARRSSKTVVTSFKAVSDMKDSKA